MASIISGTAFTPFPSGLKHNGVVRRYIDGTTGDDSEVVAAVTGKRHVIVGGRLSCDGADRCDIYSDAGGQLLDSIEFAARATATFPVGVETETAHALVLNKVSAATAVRGYIDYVTLGSGDHCPLVA